MSHKRAESPPKKFSPVENGMTPPKHFEDRSWYDGCHAADRFFLLGFLKLKYHAFPEILARGSKCEPLLIDVVRLVCSTRPPLQCNQAIQYTFHHSRYSGPL